jgi:hypothetical protein
LSRFCRDKELHLDQVRVKPRPSGFPSEAVAKAPTW